MSPVRVTVKTAEPPFSGTVGVEVAMDTVPSAIRAVADMAVINNNKADWGKPNAVRQTKNFYVFFYPTPDSELRRNGHPRMVVIDRRSRIAKLTDSDRGA